MELDEKVSMDLDIPESLVSEALRNAFWHVKKFRVPKRNGGYRLISQPSSKLKTLQYWIIDNICAHLPVDDSAFAYRRGCSILHNANYHSANRFFLKVDLKDFFPSIAFKDFIKIVRTWHREASPSWTLNEKSEEFLWKCCFDREGRLPIGYPSSPAISNAVMYFFDRKVNAEIEKQKYGNMLYSRYADDLIFSTDQKGACRQLLARLRKIIRENRHPNISINDEKVNMSSASAGSAIVTGLRVAYDGHVTLHRKEKDHIRLLLSLYRKRRLDKDECQSLLGHISYAKHVDPRFYSRI